jgi:hypothetical protein
MPWRGSRMGIANFILAASIVEKSMIAATL